MAQRTGTANLPLHGGKAPAWLWLRCWNERYPPRKVQRASVKRLARAVYKLQPED